MIRAALLLLAPLALAQVMPMEVRYGAQPRTVQFSIPGAAVPLVAEGADWVCTLEIVYRVVDREGKTLDQATETIPVRLNAAQRAAAVAQPLALTRPLPQHAEAAEFRVEMTGRPAGVVFAGSLPLGAASFSTEVSVALVPFQVERSGGKLVTDLKDEDVVVMEGNEARKAKIYAVGGRQADAMPVDITLLYDRSGSMRVGAGGDPEIFRKGLLEEFPTARVAVYGFSEKLIRFTTHTRDEAVLLRALSQLNTVPPAGTPLYFAVAETIRRFDRKRPAVRILAVFSDGLDGGSDVTFAEAMREAQAAGVSIYPVVVASAAPLPPAPPPPGASRKKKGTGVAPMMARVGSAMQFRHLADSGGQDMSATPGMNSMTMLLREVTKKLRDSYVAAYQPGEGERKVRVVLRDPSLGKVIGGTRTVVR